MFFFEFFLKFVTRHHFICLILSLLLFSPFAIKAAKVRSVSSVDDFKMADQQDFQYYEKFKKIFGSDEFFVIAFHDKTIFNVSNLTLIGQLTHDLEALPLIRKVKSLSNVDDLVGGKDYFEVKRFLSELPKNEEQLISLRQKAITNKIYKANLISKDGSTAAIIVFPREDPSDPDFRTKVIEGTEKILTKYKKEGHQFYIAGWTKINHDMTDSMKKDTSKFIPITYLLISLFIWLSFRNIRLTFIAILNITICLISTIGFFTLTNITLNNVTSIVPSLVMALSLSDTVHIYSHLDRKILLAAKNTSTAYYIVLRKVFLPCLMTTITTIIGFASLVTSKLVPIQNFGVVASAGMFFEFIYAFSFLPALLLMCNPETVFTFKQPDKGIERLLLAFSMKINKYYRLILIGCGVISITFFIFASKIIVETNFVEYFKKNSATRKSIEFIEKSLSGAC